MRNIITILFLTALSLTSFGQMANESELYGSWKVEKILETHTNPNVQPIITGFKSATFTFSENGNFDITTTANSELFAMLTEMMEGVKWKFEKSKQQVRIGTEKDGYTTMLIVLREENGTKLFHLKESELTLQMKKI